MEITGSDSSCAAALEKAVLIDPGFSAKLLAQANSAHFALPKKVSSIREAVMFIGLRQVRQTAMAVGVFDMFLGKNDKESLRRRSWWRHSVDAGNAARALAEDLKYEDPNEAYTAGLLHWIGKTILDKSNPGDYERVLEVSEKGVPLWQAESAVFGCDHRDVAVASAGKWGFPESLISGLEYYRRPEDSNRPSRLAALICVSSAIAEIACLGRSHTTGALRSWETWANAALGIGPEMTDRVIERGLAAIAAGAQHG
jgi:HD-like signal output (HDOD) protein